MIGIMTNFLKSLSAWVLAAGIEINPDGSGFRLARQTDFFNFETDEGITWEDAGSGEAWGNNLGTLRSANDLIELIGGQQGSRTRAFKAAFSILGDFTLDYKLRGLAGSGLFMVGVADNSKYPFGVGGMSGDGISNALLATYQGFGASLTRTFSEPFKLGVATADGPNSWPISITSYVRLERSGTTFTQKVYSDEARSGGGLIFTITSLNVSIATMDRILFISAYNSGSGIGYNVLSDFELFNGITNRYLNTSPVATMGWVSLAAGAVVNGVGNEITELEGSSTIQAAYRANNGAWTSPFASIALMNADLLANPVTITDDTDSFDVRLTFNSDGLEQAEAFISEGPDLTGGAGGAASPMFGGGVISA